METARVELASKDNDTQASTRVVGILYFASISAYQQASDVANLIRFD